ncbi:MAG: cytochrome P450 [Myxococcota bacterium]|nr:cytochrome P450 [Myxococcota bacterium]
MVDYDPFSAEIIHGDPYPTYRRLQDEAPVFRIERYGCFALSRFADVWEACSHPAYSAAQGTTAGHLLTRIQPVAPMLNVMDPPHHTRLRAQLRGFFSPRRMRALEPEIRRFVGELLDTLVEKGEFDVVRDFAQPLSTFVAAKVSGFPFEDGAEMRDRIELVFSREEGTDAVTDSGIRAMQEIFEYFTRFSAERRKRPSKTEDVLATLHAFEIDGRSLADDEVASHLSLFLIGGTDTLPKAFANAIVRLYDHPDQRARVAVEPALALDAFNEALRIDAPTQYMCRLLLEDVEIRGETMPADSPVLLLYAAANRDTREFGDADVFRLDRRPPRFLGFSHGTHGCIGMHVARTEARIGIEEILARNPEYAVFRDRAEPYQNEFVKGLAKLPMRL